MKFLVNAAAGLAEACDSFGVLEPFCIPIATAIALVKATIDNYSFAMDLHNFYVNSAEVEAGFENSRVIVDQLCQANAQATATEASVAEDFAALEQEVAVMREEMRELFNMVRVMLTTPETMRPGWMRQTCEGGNCPLVEETP